MKDTMQSKAGDISRRTNIATLKKRKLLDVTELRKLDQGLYYRDVVVKGLHPTRQEKNDRIKEWNKKNNRPDSICPKCYQHMAYALMHAQIENKRAGGVECMACIMGTPRRGRSYPDSVQLS
jgi:hypothetical protein